MYSPRQQSIVNRILNASLRLARMKGKNDLKNFSNMRHYTRPPKLMESMFSIRSESFRERQIWHLGPQKDPENGRILFLHGGGYAANMTPGHWFFAGALIDHLHCSVIIPDYPLAPEQTVCDVFAMLLPYYEELDAISDVSDLIIMGDSAGGGLTLALAEALKEERLPQPARLYLLSPWLDVTMSNPDIQGVDPIDPILNIGGLIECGKAYAGELETTHYRVSPLYGALNGLAPVSLYIGTHDILMPDCRKFKVKAEESGLPLDYHEIDGLLHDGMLYPIPEGKACRHDIIASLKRQISGVE